MFKRVAEELLLYAHKTPKNIKGSWSHYTDTSEPVDGNGAQNMVTVQSGFQTRDLSHKHQSILGAAGHIILTAAS
jgi:hypothetical protein